MASKTPKKLKKEPLIEAVWEVRFTSDKSSVADLIPGLIFKSLPARYPNIVRLPAADVPSNITESNINFKYIPKLRLEGENNAVQIGEHVLSLSCRRPYSGWKTFSKDILTLIEIIKSSKLIESLERFSLKYVDLIESNDLKCLNIAIKLDNFDIDKKPVQLRMEIHEDDLIHIVQIVSPAEVSLPNEKSLTGVLLDTDTIRQFNEGGSWQKVEEDLDRVHTAIIKIFFNMLTEKTIKEHQPVYEVKYP